MKTYRSLMIIVLFAVLLSACTNIPVVPTKTPTMSAEELMLAAQATAEELHRETETQWAIDNPSPTPTDTATPTPEATPTSALPMIPPTATEKALPFYHIDDVSALVRENGNPNNYSDFVPRTNLYIEVCFKNGGSGVWNEGYYAQVTNLAGANIQPRDPVSLGRSVSNGEWACFSFNNIGGTDYKLGTYCPGFQLYSDTGAAIRGGYVSACWTIH